MQLGDLDRPLEMPHSRCRRPRCPSQPVPLKTLRVDHGTPTPFPLGSLGQMGAEVDRRPKGAKRAMEAAAR
jgi:hypothetical protein